MLDDKTNRGGILLFGGIGGFALVGVVVSGTLYHSQVSRNHDLIQAICSPIDYIVRFDRSCPYN